MTKTAEQADVVFPLAAFTELSGTITNAESRLRKFKDALNPLTGLENWKILPEISKRLGYPMRYKSVDDVLKEILVLVPEYKKEIAVFRNGYTPQPEILKQAAIVRPFIQMEADRWVPGTGLGVDVFDRNIENALKFADEREEVILHHLDILRYQTFTECQ